MAIPEGFVEEQTSNIIYLMHAIDISCWEKPEIYDEGGFKGLKFHRKGAKPGAINISSKLF